MQIAPVSNRIRRQATQEITTKRDFSGKAAGDKNRAEIYLGGEYASRKR